jgi:hypothetical protein
MDIFKLEVNLIFVAFPLEDSSCIFSLVNKISARTERNSTANA